MYKILQIRPKFAEFLETCHREQLQYLTRYKELSGGGGVDNK